MKKYLTAVSVLFIIVALFSFAQPTKVDAALSSSTIVNLLIRLGIIPSDKADQAQKAVSDAEIAQNQNTPSFCYTFNQDFGIGATAGSNLYANENADLKNLWAVLQKEGFDVGEDMKLSRYGESTSAAVVKLQAKYGIRQTGYVGPLTRGQLNRLYRCGAQASPAPTTSPAPISKSPITVLNPNGGETISAGQSYTFRWENRNAPAYVTLKLVSSAGIDTPIATQISNTGSYTWTIPSNILTTTSYRLYVYAGESGIGDASDSYFTIVNMSTPSTVSVLSPNGGESWVEGSYQTIRWSSNGSDANQAVEINLERKSPTDTQFWNIGTIATNQSGSGTYSWRVSAKDTTGNVIAGSQYKILIGRNIAKGTGPVDESDYGFAITTTQSSPTPTTSPTPIGSSGKCGLIVTSIQPNTQVSFPLTIQGTIDNSNSQNLGCSWQMFEGQAGLAQLYYNYENSGWKPIGVSSHVQVSDWTATRTSFSTTLNFNNGGIGIPGGTPMKISFTEENASGIPGAADIFDLSVVLR